MDLDELNSNVPDTNEEAIDQEEINEEQGEAVADTNEGTSTEELLDSEAGTTAQENIKEETTEEGISELSGIERYLSQFDIEGGMISFDDGSKSHFSELSSEKQSEVLSGLHGEQATSTEDKYGLDDTEIGLINYLREKNTTIDEVIDELAEQRAQTYIRSQQVQNTDITKLDDDAIYTAFLLKSNPEATTEQLEKDLVKAKEMDNFTNIAKNLRTRFEDEKEQQLAKNTAAEKTQLTTQIESQRKEVVDVVAGMDNVDGLAINDGIKNDVLDIILNVDEDGDSLFMTKVFSNPSELFKAAFWYKNGSDVMSSREDFWKKEKSAAYKRGLKDASLGKKTFSASDVEDKNKTTPHRGDYTDSVSLDELYI